MILTRDVILDEIKKGRIVIEPFNENSLGPVSYDLTLGRVIRIFKEDVYDIDLAEVNENPDIIRKYTKRKVVDKFYPLKPGELVLGITEEIIRLPNDIAGLLIGRSRFARMGLMIYVSANLVQPGVNNRQIFEIYNASRQVIKLYPGLKIGQIIFIRCEGKSEYSGIWKNQLEI
ncbi:MAG: dCTP deaminase [Desulfurococcales archaeon ex4484_217_2]|nr:MAG: dCTP deaminase [Desulfurococcales archaeon ex4484_217_2]